MATTTTPYTSLIASYRRHVHDHVRHTAGGSDASAHSAALLSAHLGLLSSIFGRQGDVQSLDPAPPGGVGGDEAGDGCSEVRVELEAHELWAKFDAHCTEMVITKSGRYVRRSVYTHVCLRYDTREMR